MEVGLPLVSYFGLEYSFENWAADVIFKKSEGF